MLGDLKHADPWLMAADIFDPQPMPYATNPVGWVKDKLGEFPWSKQVEILESLVKNRRTAVPSAHDVGKSFIASRAVCWWLDQHPPGEAFAITTAPTGHQVKSILWREINLVAGKFRLPGKINKLEWWIGNVQVGMGRKPNDYEPTAFQGIHARYVLVVIDEACGVRTELWDAVDTLIANEECRILAIGNPDDPTSEFARACASPDWNTIHINGLESPNLTGENVPAAIRPLLVSKTWVEEKKRKWGTDSPLWISKVTGRFPDISTDTVIPLAWARRATEREPNTVSQPKRLACDVARYGSDETVIGLRVGHLFRVLKRLHGKSTVESAREVQAQLKWTKSPIVFVDDNGLGAGVVDSLEDWGCPVRGLNTANKASDPEMFVNCRAEWYWQLREAFEKGEVIIDDDDDLIAQLTTLKYRIVPGTNKIEIESKEDMKRRGLPSPDLADCMMMAFATPAVRRMPNLAAGMISVNQSSHFHQI